MYTYIYICIMYIYIYTCISLSLSLYIYIYTCVYVYIYIYMIYNICRNLPYRQHDEKGAPSDSEAGLGGPVHGAAALLRTFGTYY